MRRLYTVASGSLAGVLHGLDAVELRGPDFTVAPTASGRRPGARRRILPAHRVVAADGVPCTDGVQTLVDLAQDLDDLRWERALESALRKCLVRLGDVEGTSEESGRGVRRMRRVLSLRPIGAPPTESVLETAMVQLARSVPLLPPSAVLTSSVRQWS